MKKNIYAVIGDPVFHSLSPLIHNYLYKQYNINAEYIPIEIKKDNISNLDIFIKGLDLKGLNVTMPHKESVIQFLDIVDINSRFAVNTITIRDNIKKGYSTDGNGFILSLDEISFDPKNKNIVILGAGGACRAIVDALVKTSPKSLSVLNRSLPAINTLQKTYSSIKTDTLDSINTYMENCDLLINTTPLGMKTDFESFDFLAKLKKDAIVYDIIYNPYETNLLKNAKNLNLATTNGIHMLIYQAFLAFNLFFDIMPTQKDKDHILNLINNIN